MSQLKRLQDESAKIQTEIQELRALAPANDQEQADYASKLEERSAALDAVTEQIAREHRVAEKLAAAKAAVLTSDSDSLGDVTEARKAPAIHVVPKRSSAGSAATRPPRRPAGSCGLSPVVTVPRCGRWPARPPAPARSC